MKKYCIVFFIAIGLITSCTQIQALRKIKSKNATTEEWRAENKTVIFLPMAHLSQPDFYTSVKKIITEKKAEGFTVYYEMADMKPIDETTKARLLEKPYIKFYRGSNDADSICRMIYKKKMAKLIGLFPDSAAYKRLIPETGYFKGLVSQPGYKELGIDAYDKHVDYSQIQLVDKYEELYGEIILEQKDFSITTTSIYPKSYRLPKDKVNTILIDYRDQNLAKNIQNAPDKKILVIYGLVHMKGTYKELRRLDESWRKL